MNILDGNNELYQSVIFVPEKRKLGKYIHICVILKYGLINISVSKVIQSRRRPHTYAI